MNKQIFGRPPQIKKILRVQALRNKGLTFRQIAKLENSDVKTVFRWCNYHVGKKWITTLDSVGKKV